MNDPINPNHYKQGDIECIEAIKAALGYDGFKAYCRGQVVKYIWRAEHKGNAAVDYRKAEWYANRLVEEVTFASPMRLLRQP
jgi:hypothetical protein